MAALSLQGCGGGPAVQETANADGGDSGATPPATTNAVPTISGSPSLAVQVGSQYTFTPSAADPNGDKLSFSIANQPAWATFDTATGALTGSPAAGSTGTFSGVTISVTDGKAIASLAPFAITVGQASAGAGAGAATGTANVSWIPPTTRSDGSTLNNLSGYRIYYGNDPEQLDVTVQINNPGVASYVIDNLAAGTYYFAVTAVDASGVESGRSDTASKKIG